MIALGHRRRPPSGASRRGGPAPGRAGHDHDATVATGAEAEAECSAAGPACWWPTTTCPDLDGLSLCLRLSTSGPPVVLYSAFADDSLAVLAMIAGARAIVPKSADPADLVSHRAGGRPWRRAAERDRRRGAASGGRTARPRGPSCARNAHRRRRGGRDSANAGRRGGLAGGTALGHGGAAAHTAAAPPANGVSDCIEMHNSPYWRGVCGRQAPVHDGAPPLDIPGMCRRRRHAPGRALVCRRARARPWDSPGPRPRPRPGRRRPAPRAPPREPRGAGPRLRHSAPGRADAAARHGGTRAGAAGDRAAVLARPDAARARGVDRRRVPWAWAARLGPDGQLLARAGQARHLLRRRGPAGPDRGAPGCRRVRHRRFATRHGSRSPRRVALAPPG